MIERYRQILDPDISAQERDILCVTFFGKPFSEAIYEMRSNDLKKCVEAGDYFILAVRIVDTSMADEDDPPAVEIRFKSARLYDLYELQSMRMLYAVDSPTLKIDGMYGFTNINFYATLYGVDAVNWAVAQIRARQQMF